MSVAATAPPHLIQSSQPSISTTIDAFKPSTKAEVPVSVNKAYAHDWTLKSNAMLLELRDRQVSWRNIAARMGKSDAACVKHYNNILAPAFDPSGVWYSNSAMDVKLLQKRLLEKKNWQEIGDELGIEVKSCQARFKGALEPWLKGGMGHGEQQCHIQLGSYYARFYYKTKDIFEAISKEQGVNMGEIQGWYDHYVLTTFHPTRNKTSDLEWTKDMDRVLIRMRTEERASWAEIQEALGKNYISCLSRFQRVGFQKSLVGAEDIVPRQAVLELHQGHQFGHGSMSDFWTPERDELLLRMKETPELTWEDIGNKLGTSRGYCHNRYKTVLQPMVEKSWTKHNTEQLKQMVAQGMLWNDISAALGISHLACKQQWIVSKENEAMAGKAVALGGLRKSTKGPSYNSLLQRRIERYYDDHDWNQLLAAQFSGISDLDEELKRQQRQHWLKQHPPWTDLEETRLIQQVLRRGLTEWGVIAEAVNKGLRRKHGISAAECRMRWKNLDMPVRRAVDFHDWKPSSQRLFWSRWLHYSRIVSEGERCDDRGDIWEKICQDPRIPGDKEQCKLYFETATRKLESLTNDRIVEFAHKQAATGEDSNADSKSSHRRPRHHWSKRRSAMLQSFVRLQLRRSQRMGKTRISWTGVVRRMNWRPQWDGNDQSPDGGRGDVQVMQCLSHWKQHLSLAPGPRWDHSELKLLEQGIREFGYEWREIQRRYLPWRKASMLIPQWYLISERPARVTVDEYMALLQTVEELHQQGEQSIDDELGSSTSDMQLQSKDAFVDWKEVASKMPGWMANPCRRVYEQSYKYLMDHTRFSTEEDAWLLANMRLNDGKDEGQDWSTATERFKDSGKSAWLYRLRWCQLIDDV
ncbi:hypothetical protein BGX28_006513 [Mortierella sp. GBA30]|nr:hypothetical protein BGX28_006513 [Mortierella sp. GBA30]